MSTEQAVQEKAWSRRKFWMVLCLVFGLQLALLFLFGRPVPSPLDELPRRTSFRMLAKNVPTGAFDALLVTDPTLFVLPNRDSFSGAAWLNVKEMDYSPTEWTEAPSYLRFRPEKLTTAFKQFVEAGRNPLMQVSEKLPPYEPTPAPPAVAAGTKSRMRVDGAIASRVTSEMPNLIAWQNNEPLDRSIVEVGVNEGGQVVSVRLINRSGLSAADQAALKLAGALRFSPLSSVNLMLGRINFVWHTEPLAATNATPLTIEAR